MTAIVRTIGSAWPLQSICWNELPAHAWRVFAGCFLTAHWGVLLHEDFQRPATRYFLEGAQADVWPQTQVSLLQFEPLQHHPWAAWAVALVASVCVVVGRFVRPAALLLFAIAVSMARSSYPLVGALDQVVVHTSLWCALLADPVRGHPRRRSGCQVSRCGALTCLGSTVLLLRGIDFTGSTLSAIVCAVELGLMGWNALCPSRTGAARVSGSMTVGGVLFGLSAWHSVASWDGAAGAHTTSGRLLMDLGVVCLAPAFASAPDLHVRTRLPEERELPAREVWAHPGAARALSYAVWAPSTPGEPVMDRLKRQGKVRLWLAEHACARFGPSVTAEVAAANVGIFWFRCDGTRPRLQVPPADLAVGVRDPAVAESSEAIKVRRRYLEQRIDAEVPTQGELSQYLLDSWRVTAGSPTQELIRVARVHFARSEFEEARRLVELAYDHATPATRRRAGLLRLREVVAAAAP